MASMQDILSFEDLDDVLQVLLSNENAPQFPKNNMMTLISLSSQGSSVFTNTWEQLKRVISNSDVKDNNVDTFFDYLRNKQLSLETFYIILQSMYFTEDRVFLIAIPQLQDSLKYGTGKPSHQTLLTSDIVQGSVGVTQSLSFSTTFNNSKVTTQIERSAIVFSCNNRKQFLDHLVNTGKNYAYFYYRIWEGLFPDLLNGITYLELINFMEEFDDVSMLEMFMFHWGYHMDNPFFKKTPSLKHGSSTIVKQWFDTEEQKIIPTHREEFLTAVEKLLTQTLKLKSVKVQLELTPKLLANKRANGFFANISKKDNTKFILSLCGNNLIPDVIYTEYMPLPFEYMTLLENSVVDYGIKRINNTQEDKSITGMGDSLATSIRTLSPNLKNYFHKETWSNESNIDLLDQFIRTDIDLLLVLIALKESYNIMELFQCANKERQLRSVSKVSYTQSPSEIIFNLAQLIVSKTQNTQTVDIDEDTLKQDCFDTVIKRTLPDVTYDQVKDKLTVDNGKVTFDFYEVIDLSGMIKVMPNIKNTSLSTLQTNYNNFTNGNQTNGNRDFDKEKEFCLNLMKVITNK